jgi:hypothetical protein
MVRINNYLMTKTGSVLTRYDGQFCNGRIEEELYTDTNNCSRVALGIYNLLEVVQVHI